MITVLFYNKVPLITRKIFNRRIICGVLFIECFEKIVNLLLCGLVIGV